MQGLWQQTVADGLDRLDDACDPGRGLGVTDVRLQRPQPQRPVIGAARTVDGQQRLCLDGVAEGGAGPVGLDRVHLGGGQFRAGQGVADHPLLRGAVRRGQPVGLAVLVHRGATHHREHLVAAASRLTEPLQQQQPDAFGPAGPVRRRGECLAAAVGGQAPLPGELHEPLRRGHHCHTAGQRQVAFTRPQRPRGQMQRYQGRRAGRVHGYRRALETEGVGDPA